MSREYVRLRGKIRGYINQNRVYVSKRNISHWFYKFSGFGISLSILDFLFRRAVSKIWIVTNVVINGGRIYEGAELMIYQADRDTFYDFGHIYRDNSECVEELQLILNFEHFKCVGGITEKQMVLSY